MPKSTTCSGTLVVHDNDDRAAKHCFGLRLYEPVCAFMNRAPPPPFAVQCILAPSTTVYNNTLVSDLDVDYHEKSKKDAEADDHNAGDGKAGDAEPDNGIFYRNYSSCS